MDASSYECNTYESAIAKLFALIIWRLLQLLGMHFYNVVVVSAMYMLRQMWKIG